MKAKYYLLLLPFTLMLNSCTSLNEVQYYNNGMNDLNGTWVVSDKYSSGVQDIVLHVGAA